MPGAANSWEVSRRYGEPNGVLAAVLPELKRCPESKAAEVYTWLEQQLSLQRSTGLQLKPRPSGVTLTVTESESLVLHSVHVVGSSSSEKYWEEEYAEKPVPGTNSMALAERQSSGKI
jgi:hypothetical protein